ncbi:MAG: hypothetical protein CVU46_04925 [Chloroflexi bacterium HGW-Chloroflexi-8]|nr:MAG: hypothetical protein CVU46_04925 [Chloroflexi bacterium HGW-Chloroflexi-8]
MLSELANYLTRIEELHSQTTTPIQVLPVDMINRRLFDQDSGSDFTPFAILVAHISEVEQFWICEKAGIVPSHRNINPEFKTITHDNIDFTRPLSQTSMITNKIFINLSSEKLDEN